MGAFHHPLGTNSCVPGRGSHVIDFTLGTNSCVPGRGSHVQINHMNLARVHMNLTKGVGGIHPPLNPEDLLQSERVTNTKQRHPLVSPFMQLVFSPG